MRFVKVTHPDVGEATVPEVSVPNMLRNRWTLIDEGEMARLVTAKELSVLVGDPTETAPEAPFTDQPVTPTKRASRARTSYKES